MPILHTVAGGIFPFPPLITDLVKRLPPPYTFEGPFVKIDEFLAQMQSIELRTNETSNISPEDFQLAYVYVNGQSMRELEHLSYVPQTLTISQVSGYGNKRSNANVNTASAGVNSDDEDSKKRKSMDIYKQRQYKKLMQNT